VARTGQSGPGRGKPRLALMMSLRQKLEKGQPASADYLRFCSKEKLPRDVRRKRDKYISCLAAYHGHLPLLQELLEPWSLHVVQDVTRAAARGGQLEILQWMKTQKGFKMDADLFESACEGGHWEIIRWLRSEGCPWDAKACYGAAWSGHLEMLK